MKEWKVVLTPEFKQEFRDIYAYIADVLLAPEAAKRQAKRILDQVEGLSDMPNRFSLVKNKLWRSRGLRKMMVDSYIVFFFPNELSSEVVVFHVFYGGRDIDELLKTNIEKG